MEKDLLAKKILSDCFDKIVESYSQSSLLVGFSDVWLREIIELSILFNYDKLFARSSDFLKTAHLENPFKGSFTNIQESEAKTIEYHDRIRRISTVEEIKEKHLFKSRKEILAELSIYKNEHFVETLNGNFQEALKMNPSQGKIEEIANILCIMEDFNSAALIIKNYLSDQKDIPNTKIVYLIEYSRAGEFSKTIELYNQLNLAHDSIWDKLIIAKGLKGLEPWPCYPFPDY